MRPLQQLLHVREAAPDLAVVRHRVRPRLRERLLDPRRGAVAVVGELLQRVLLGRYAVSSLAEPDASAFVSASSVSVANWPTLELICS